ncbi:MAG: DUF308 domain-containing protein [Solobacterium sp.]|nr:DUF308 domain-containing protein [Solobacterium sp.]
MAIASIILGIIFIIGGVICITTPVNTYFSVMAFFAAILLVYGIYGIIRFFKRRALVPEFLISIASVIIGFVYLFRPGNTASEGLLGLDRIVLFLTAAWFLVKGCITVYYSVKTRFFNNRWVLLFISGLLSVILGIYSFIYPSTAAVSIGVLIGMWEIQCGIDFLTLGTAVGFIQQTVDEVEQEINDRVEEVASMAERVRQEAAEQIRAAEEKVQKEPVETVEAVPAENAEDVKIIPIETPDDTKTDK